VIANFRDEWLRAFFVDDRPSGRVPREIEDRLFRKLQMIDDATSDSDLRAPPSNHFEKLRCAARSPAFIRSESTGAGVCCSVGTAQKAAPTTCTWTTTVIGDGMLTTKRKPVSVGEILGEEFLRPLGLTQTALAEAMGAPRKHVNELCNDRRRVTAATALILAAVFGNTPDFWLNAQRRIDLWEAMNDPRQRARVERAKPLGAAA
jgi:addiction module HigA family antidote